MPVETLLISGPRCGGKTTAARLITEQVMERPIHYLRMRLATDGHTNAVLVDEDTGRRSTHPQATVPDWASSHTVSYTPDRLFEIVPEALRAVRRIERKSFVIIEADEDPALRHAYPYDHRVFVMSNPSSDRAVFRTPEDAASALQQVLHDTAAFASEMFGLFDAAGLDDSMGIQHTKPIQKDADAAALEKLDIGESQIRQFLTSPLGAEISCRVQLQPEYHAVVESDVVVINACVEATDREKESRGKDCVLDKCVNRLERLLSRVCQDTRRQSVLYWGDILDRQDPMRAKLLRRLRALLLGDPL